MTLAQLRYIAITLGLALAYYIAAVIGLSFGNVTPQVSTVWPPTGIALVALLVLGIRYWPGVFLGALIANATAQEPFWVASGIAMGNTLEAVLGAYWLKRFGKFHYSLDRLRDVFALLIFSGVFSTAISATIGVTSLGLGGLIPWQSFQSVWQVWWIGDMMGALVLAPLLLQWSRRRTVGDFWREPIEPAAMLALLLVIGEVIFARDITNRAILVPAYLFPFIIWSALRFKQIGTATVTFFISVMAVLGTLQFRGPFSAQPLTEYNLILLQLFIFVAAMTGMVLAAEVMERKSAEERLLARGRELQALNQSLNDALRQVQENEKSLVTTVQELEQTKVAMLNILEDLEHSRSTAERDKAQAEAMLLGIGDGLVVVGEDGKITMANRRFEELTGWTISAAIGLPIQEVLPAQNESGQPIPNLERPYSRALQTRQIVTTRVGVKPYYYMRRDGTRFPVAITVAPFMRGQQVIGSINVFRDMTKELEVDRAKTEFVSIASHQLRTPLTIIRWSADMLRKYAGQLTPEQSKYLGAIEQTGRQMVSLVDALLDVSRIEMGTLMIDPHPIKLGALIEDILGELKPLIDARSHHLTKRIQHDIPTINLDPQLIRVVVHNLLTNAIKYTPPKGKISVSVSTIGPNVQVRVSDSGIGITPADTSKIFSKLFRADNAKLAETEGTGLGLYIAQAVIKQSGGRIWFESKPKPESGTIFFFTLPLQGVAPRAGTKTLNVPGSPLPPKT